MVCELIIFTADVFYGKDVTICAHHYVKNFVGDVVKGLVIVDNL